MLCGSSIFNNNKEISLVDQHTDKVIFLFSTTTTTSSTTTFYYSGKYNNIANITFILIER